MAPHVEAITGDLLADVGPRFDLIDGLALPLPVRVISELLGIPAADQSMLVRWSAALSRIGSITIPSNSIIVMLVGAANRDPALCDSPGTFDITRGVRRHLAFGHGITSAWALRSPASRQRSRCGTCSPCFPACT